MRVGRQERGAEEQRGGGGERGCTRGPAPSQVVRGAVRLRLRLRLQHYRAKRGETAAPGHGAWQQQYFLMVFSVSGCVAGIIDAVNIVATSWHSTAPDAVCIQQSRPPRPACSATCVAS
jgi:hypothetical protein